MKCVQLKNIKKEGSLKKKNIFERKKRVSTRFCHNVSTVGSSQSVLSTQSKEFVVLQQHTAHLAEKYKQLSAIYEQLHQMIMNMSSHSGDTCAPSFWPYSSGNNQPPPPPPSPALPLL